jgi:hypothetical protein
MALPPARSPPPTSPSATGCFLPQSRTKGNTRGRRNERSVSMATQRAVAVALGCKRATPAGRKDAEKAAGRKAPSCARGGGRAGTRSGPGAGRPGGGHPQWSGRWAGTWEHRGTAAAGVTPKKCDHHPRELSEPAQTHTCWPFPENPSMAAGPRGSHRGGSHSSTSLGPNTGSVKAPPPPHQAP